MAQGKKLPGFDMTKDELVMKIEDYFKLFFDKEYSFEYEQCNEKETDIIITIGTEIPSFILTIQERKDNKVSLAIRKNKIGTKSFLAARKIRDELYQYCGIGKTIKPNDVYERVNEEEFGLIISYLDEVKGLEKKEHVYINNHYWEQYEDCTGVKLTIHYYPSTRKLMCQTGTQELLNIFNNAISDTTGIQTKKEQQAEYIARGLALSEELTLEKDLKKYLGNDLLRYIHKHNKKLEKSLNSAFKTKREKKTMSSKDYSGMVQNICRCYESLILTMFDRAGIPRTRVSNDGRQIEMFVAGYFFIDEKNNIYSLRYQYYRGMPRRERDLLGQFFKPYRLYRNPASHGDEENNHRIIPTYEEALDEFNQVAYGMRKSFSILVKYDPAP